MQQIFLERKKVELHLKLIDRNLVDSISNKKTSNYKPFYSINDDVVGETYKSKISSTSSISFYSSSYDYYCYYSEIFFYYPN